VDPLRGLPPDEVAARRARYGPNALRAAPATPWWKLLLRQFTEGLILVLLGAAVLWFEIVELVGSDFIGVGQVLKGVIG
jgi:Ca2+-transporting ATPase